MLTRMFWRWVPLAATVAALCLLIAFVTQQLWRQMANDPQVQMARDAAVRLADGQPPASVLPAGPIVDIAHSLSPFVLVFDDREAIVAASGRLRGVARGVPAGVLANVRDRGEARVTWQPERDIRIATVISRYDGARGGGFVLAGRSLRETEARIAAFQRAITIAGVALAFGLFAIVAASESIS